MSEAYREYRAVYLQGFDKMLALTVVTAVCVYSIYIMALHHDVLAFAIYLVPSLILPVGLLAVFNYKVRFGIDFIEKSTLLGKSRLYVKDIQSFGVLRTNRNGIEKISESAISKISDDNAANFNIYALTTPELSIKTIREKDAIVLPFRSEIYKQIREKLNG